MISTDEIDVAFQCLLGRRPESQQVVCAFQSLKSVDDVIAQINLSMEAQRRSRSGPFWHYNAQIDPLAIIASHENVQRRAVSGRLVNFLGVIIDPRIAPSLLSDCDGKVEGLPVPSNWHADIAEFGAALRAVDLAEGTFRVLELGCGWGCWLLNTGVAARSRGLTVELIGVEGDEGHVGFALAGCAENGFGPDQVRIVRGIVGPASGVALFPNQDAHGGSWGLEPVFGASEDQIMAAERGGRHTILPVLTLDALAEDGKLIDLVHLDIQGGEADFVESCMEGLNRLAAYVVIGTHSREIEGRIIATMLRHEWILEIERPAIFTPLGRTLHTSTDGVQGWRNPRLRRG